MLNQYILLENFFKPSDELLDILINKSGWNQGRVGDSVDTTRKRRMDFFINENNCSKNIIKELDDNIFYKLNNIIKDTFNFDIKYRESYKIGHYSSIDRGYYNSHTDKQGGMDYRNISMVICLSKKEDYQGGEFILNTLGKIFKLDYGDLLLFRSELIHNVLPVYSGDRYVIISFMFDELHSLFYKTNYVNFKSTLPFGCELNNTSNKYLYNILISSGPSNQIISIKESYVIAKLTNRKLILPKIYPHTSVNKKKIFIDFDKIYNIKDDDVISFNDNCELLNKINNIYGFSTSSIQEEFIHESYIKDSIYPSNVKHTVLLNGDKPKFFKKIEDFRELYNISDEVLCIKRIFNTVLFNDCPINNAFDSKLNFNLYKIYNHICSIFDFSDFIKNIGDKYIEDNFNGKDFIALHLRYPDNHMFNSINKYLNYSEDDISNKLVELCDKYDINHNNIFIATNNKYGCKSTNLYKNKFLDLYNIQNYGIYNDDIDIYSTFIEQYICCKSKIFLMSKYNDYTKKDLPNQRSTWSSFVRDYRLNILKLDNNSNIIFDDIMNNL
jgi:hypothetical protein